jgi:hypothetical protein
LEVRRIAWGDTGVLESELNIPFISIKIDGGPQPAVILEVVLALERPKAEVRPERVLKIRTVPFEVCVELVRLWIDEEPGKVLLILGV